jgi:nucleoside-diphosphate-sugar epimerase
MSRVLLTGASGFVGSAILRRLVSQGDEVVTLGRADRAPSPDVDHLQLDLLSAAPDRLHEVVREADSDGLIHAAWYTNHADYLVADVNRSWLDASTRLFEAFREASPGRIVGLGTCVEYAPEGGRCTEGETPLRPNTLYGECKKALSERLLAMADSAWARIFFVYGPGDRAGRLVPHLLDRARAGEAVSVSYGGLRRDYIHIDDLAAQIVAVAHSELTGPVNTGTGRASALADIARAACEAAGRPELAVPNDRVDAAQPLVIEADMTRYEAAIGPVRCRSLLEGLRPLFQAASD